MKKIIQNVSINLGALWITTQLIPAVSISQGVKGLLISALIFMVVNIMIVPIFKVILLPLNLLTLGIFTWVANVLAFYFLVNVSPFISVSPYDFPGLNLGAIIIPGLGLSTLQVVIVASFLIGFLINLINWLRK